MNKEILNTLAKKNLEETIAFNKWVEKVLEELDEERDKMVDFKRYFIKIYRKGKIIKTVDLYSTYEDIEKGALNKAVAFKNQDGYYLDIHFFDKADRFEIKEIGE